MCAALTFCALWALNALHPLAYLVGGAVLLKTTFSVQMLRRSTLTVRDYLSNHRVQEARASLGALVSRDTSKLTPPLIAAAAIESVAENASDSAVAPWLAFALFGVPGAMAYRAMNTADAMIGYHGKFEFLGKVAARLDDVANLIPARLTALCIVAGSALAKAHPGETWRCMRQDHAKTESPNAGWPMAAMAGGLMVQLEKAGFYTLGGRYPQPTAAHVTAAVRVTAWALTVAALTLIPLVVFRYVLI